MPIRSHRIGSFLFLLDTGSFHFGLLAGEIALDFRRWTFALAIAYETSPLGLRFFGLYLVARLFGLLPLGLSPLTLGFAFYPCGGLAFFLLVFARLVYCWYSILSPFGLLLRLFVATSYASQTLFLHGHIRGIGELPLIQPLNVPQLLPLYYRPPSIEGFQWKPQQSQGNDIRFEARVK